LCVCVCLCVRVCLCVLVRVGGWAQLETGYQIWDFKGKALYRMQQDKFYMFLWRPRPPTLLSKDRVRDIKKNIKEYAAEFTKQDELRENKALRMVIERRRALMDAWLAFRKAAIERYEAVRASTMCWQGGVRSETVCVVFVFASLSLSLFLCVQETDERRRLEGGSGAAAAAAAGTEVVEEWVEEVIEEKKTFV
jgi:hypothetical protein